MNFSCELSLIQPLRSWLLLVCLCAAAFISNASDLESKGTGYIEEAHYQADRHQLSLSGWAAPGRPSVFLTNIIVLLNNHEVYRGRMEGVSRPDVNQDGGVNGWLASGFRLTIDLPTSIASGPYRLTARVRQGNGEEFPLEVLEPARSVSIKAVPGPPLGVIYALLVAVCLPLVVFGLSFVSHPRNPLQMQRGLTWFGSSLLLSFALLIATGTTGSSLQIAMDASPFVHHDGQKWVGQLRFSRADEWQAFTPMALSQLAHQPPFPVVNKLIGEDGQNMLIVGMAGAPVAHISAFAKPATWGFFFLDLRRALSWYWWLPFFGCFAALLFLLTRFHQTDWRVSAVLSLSFAAAPYSVAFSGWPAYIAMFPILAIIFTDLALTSRRMLSSLSFGLLVGLCIAGFVLVLYPGWMISISYLLVPYGIAVLNSRRASIQFGRPQVAALVMALAVSSCILLAWWTSAHDAIEALRNSVYPGQRSAEVGGDIDRWFLIKGMLNLATMYQPTSMMGECDAASYVFFLLPAIAGLLIKIARAKRIDVIDLAILASVSWTLWFMYIGFNSMVAKWSLWSLATTYRMDLVLGLAQILMFARIFAPTSHPQSNSARSSLITPEMASIALTIALAILAFQILPPTIKDNLPASSILLLVSGVAIGSTLLLTGRSAAFVLIFGTWTLCASLPFNPIGQAPNKIVNQLADPLRSDIAEGSARVAIFGAQTAWSQSLIATGIPVVNAVLYHPQQSLWNRLDPNHLKNDVHNRYQNLLFVQGKLATDASFKIESPRLDAVSVTFEPAFRDFDLLGATHLLFPAANLQALQSRNDLQLLASGNNWAFLKAPHFGKNEQMQ